MRVLASALPPAPLAVRVKVVDLVGETDCEPLVATVPISAMEAEVALVVVHDRVADCPESITDGVTVMLAVGAGAGAGGGGDGGGGAAAFLWHPPRTTIAARQTATGSLVSLEWFMVTLLYRCATLRQQ